MQQAVTTYLLLGSNLGDRASYLKTSVKWLSGLEGLEIVAESPVYISEPLGVSDSQPSFLNQVIKGEFLYPPIELLRACEKIERELDRDNKGEKKPRTIDIDILLFGSETLKSDELTIPHRELTKRPFALVPLLEIDRDLVHPRTKKRLDSYLTENDREQIMLYQDHVSRNFTA